MTQKNRSGKNNILISVIIPTYNRSKMLERCIRSLFKNEYPKNRYQLIVIDDKSRDDTSCKLQELAKQYRNLIVIKNAENRGQAYSLKRGVEAARGKITAFTDDDCILPGNWLRNIDMAFREHGVVCVQGTQKNGGRWGDYLLRDKELIKDMQKTNRIDTKNFMILRKLITEIPFDESFQGLEDLELSVRLTNAGIPVAYKADIYVTHVVDSFQKLMGRAESFGRGWVQIFKKYGPRYVSPRCHHPLPLVFLIYLGGIFYWWLFKKQSLKGAFARALFTYLIIKHYKDELKKLSSEKTL